MACCPRCDEAFACSADSCTDLWLANDRANGLKADLAASRAEIERLRGGILGRIGCTPEKTLEAAYVEGYIEGQEEILALAFVGPEQLDSVPLSHQAWAASSTRKLAKAALDAAKEEGE